MLAFSGKFVKANMIRTRRPSLGSIGLLVQTHNKSGGRLDPGDMHQLLSLRYLRRVRQRRCVHARCDQTAIDAASDDGCEVGVHVFARPI